MQNNAYRLVIEICEIIYAIESGLQVYIQTLRMLNMHALVSLSASAVVYRVIFQDSAVTAAILVWLNSRCQTGAVEGMGSGLCMFMSI